MVATIPVTMVAVAMTERAGMRTMRRVGGLLTVAAALVAFSACGGSKGSTPSTTAAASVDSATDAEASNGDGGATSDAAAPESLLGDALAALGSSYHFVTTVRVADKVVMTAEGDRIGAGARLELTTDTGVVSYVVTADGSWAKPENGTWAELDVPTAATDPMSALADATKVTLGPAAEGVQQIDVEVSNESLGVPGGGSATVTVQIQGSAVSQVSYISTVSGQRAEVTTVFGAARDTSEVVAPV